MRTQWGLRSRSPLGPWHSLLCTGDCFAEAAHQAATFTYVCVAVCACTKHYHTTYVIRICIPYVHCIHTYIHTCMHTYTQHKARTTQVLRYKGDCSEGRRARQPLVHWQPFQFIHCQFSMSCCVRTYVQQACLLAEKYKTISSQTSGYLLNTKAHTLSGHRLESCTSTKQPWCNSDSETEG